MLAVPFPPGPFHTFPAAACQIPPPSRYSDSNALDFSVRKSRENPFAVARTAGQHTDHRMDLQIETPLIFYRCRKPSERSRLIREKQNCSGLGADLLNSISVINLIVKLNLTAFSKWSLFACASFTRSEIKI